MENKYNLLPVITAATALFAVFFGPMIQLYVARLQQRVSVISSNRVRWIEDFRKEVAEFITATQMHQIAKYEAGEANKEENKEKMDYYIKSAHSNLLKLNTLEHILNMKLSISDKEQSFDKEIRDGIIRLVNVDVDNFSNYDVFLTSFNNESILLQDAVRKKLSAEWKRVEALN